MFFFIFLFSVLGCFFLHVFCFFGFRVFFLVGMLCSIVAIFEEKLLEAQSMRDMFAKERRLEEGCTVERRKKEKTRFPCFVYGDFSIFGLTLLGICFSWGFLQQIQDLVVFLPIRGTHLEQKRYLRSFSKPSTETRFQ